MDDRGPVRRTLTAAAAALLAAALLRWNAFAAYRVPTSSMQPTLLGSDVAGVHDRVLVDMLRYAVAPPLRWDLVAFHPPLQQADTWLKRCIGLPGERIAIAGGNLYRLEPGAIGSGATAGRREILRRPAALVAAMWREVHPARALSRDDAATAPFAATPAEAWRVRAGGWRLRLAAATAATLRWNDPDGGLVDRPWDGTPTAVARVLRARPENGTLRGEIVADARVAVTLRAETGAALERARLAIVCVRPARPTRQFALEWERGELRLCVGADREAIPQVLSAPIAGPDLTRGAQLSLAHVDGELVAAIDDREVARLDVGAFDCDDECELPDPCGAGPAMPTADRHVDVAFTFAGSGDLEVDDVRIWRDQHWSRLPGQADAPFEVPADSCFVLGDNPYDSTDSRGFDSVELHVLGDAVVPNASAGAVLLRGTRALTAADLPPRAGENPVCCVAAGSLAFTDEYGEVHRLRAPVVVDAGSQLPLLRWSEAEAAVEFGGATWHFVPLDRVLGRAILRCWPLPPFGPWRLGWLR